jgi:Ni/Fe-hydrogenase subunit HybB-like protein
MAVVTETEAGEAGNPGVFKETIKKALGGGPAYKTVLCIAGMFLLISLIAGFHAKIVGSMHLFGTSRAVVWGILIAAYIFMAVTSTGIGLVASIGHVFGVRALIPIAKRAVYLSVITILAGFYIMFFETESPFRLVYNFISPNLTSNIWWMGTLYSFYMFFMAIELYLLLKGNYRLASAIGFVCVVAGVAANGNLGAVFGMIHGRESWYGSHMPIYFISSAMMSGAAAIIFFTWISCKMMGETINEQMRRALEVTADIAILLIVVSLFFTFWKFLAGYVAGAAEQAALDALVSGPYAFNFWVFEIFCGMLLPLILLIISKRRNVGVMALASAIMIFGAFFIRYDFIIIGQLVPVYFELGVSECPGLLSYFPSIHEILIVLGAVALVVIGFMVGERIFDGHKIEIH